jgi:Ca2+-binding RTX toxin-like protein
LEGIENIIGGDGNDVFVGDQTDNIMEGGLGDDLINGSQGHDTASYAHASSSVSVSLAITVAQNTQSAGNDTLVGIENLLGSDYADNLMGGADDNTLDGGLGDDRLDGGQGLDTVSYAAASYGEDFVSGVSVDLQAGVASGSLGNDQLVNIEMIIGSAYRDVLQGNDVANTLSGNAGDDQLFGGLGDDLLKGSSGADQLTGGAGADRFVYESMADSTADLLGRDSILDFRPNEGDSIDLRLLDANPGKAKDQSFKFIDAKPFSGIGQLRYDPATQILSANTDSDFKTAEFAIQLTGFSDVLISKVFYL